MKPDAPLLIIAPLEDAFDLARIAWCEAAKEQISVNPAKFKNLEMVEVIVDAMPFLLSRLTAAETGQHLMNGDRLLPDTLSSTDSAISVALDENLASASHLPEVHQRLLLLGKWIGESLDAKAAYWMPLRTVLGFADFRETVENYLIGGPNPFPGALPDSQRTC